MRIHILRFSALLLVIVASPAWSQSTNHSVYATVVDRGGMPVDGLGSSDFTVREDETARDVVSASPAANPIDIAIIVNMAEGNISDVRQGIVDFFTAIRAPHEVALVGLERPRVTQDYTHDTNTLLRSVNALYPQQGRGVYASVYDTVLSGSRTLQKRAAARRAIIVVSDGSYGGVSSDKDGEVRRELRGCGAALYLVVVARSQPPFEYPNGTYYIKPPVSVSEIVPRASGGRVHVVLASSGVPAALAEIADEFNHQYRLDYVRPPGEGPDSLAVNVARAGLTVRATRLPPE